MQVGRQAKAGCNPFTIQLADEKFRNNTKLKAENFSGKQPNSVYEIQQRIPCASDVLPALAPHPCYIEETCQLANTGLLGGMTRDQAMSKGMLFYQDYYTVLGPDIVPEVGHL